MITTGKTSYLEVVVVGLNRGGGFFFSELCKLKLLATFGQEDKNFTLRVCAYNLL